MARSRGAHRARRAIILADPVLICWIRVTIRVRHPGPQNQWAAFRPESIFDAESSADNLECCSARSSKSPQLPRFRLGAVPTRTATQMTALDYYKLQEQPFGVTPDSRYLFLTSSHKEALNSTRLWYRVRMRFRRPDRQPRFRKDHPALPNPGHPPRQRPNRLSVPNHIHSFRSSARTPLRPRSS